MIVMTAKVLGREKRHECKRTNRPVSFNIEWVTHNRCSLVRYKRLQGGASLRGLCRQFKGGRQGERVTLVGGVNGN